MNYLQLKKRAFMKVVNSIKGTVRTASGIPPLMFEGCVDNDSLIGCTIYGNSIQDGTPTPDTPVEIESVGEKTKNLIPFPYFTKTGDYNGVKVTINTDGSITLNGTCTKLFNIYFVQTGTFSLPAGTYRVSLTPKMSGVTLVTGGGGSNLPSSVNENRMFTLDNEMPIGVCCLQVENGAVINNITFYPMIEKGSEATEYEPSCKYKIPVIARGKNLIPFPYHDGYSKTHYGVTYTVETDGTIIANGTATGSNSAFYLTMTKKITGFESGIQYTISGCTGGSNSTYEIRVAEGNGDFKRSLNGATTFEFDSNANMDRVNTYVMIRNGQTVNNLKFKPMIELGSTATEYEPYVEPVTTNIYLAEPLRKVGEYADYIDFEKQKIIRNTYKIFLNGDSTHTIILQNINANGIANFYVRNNLPFQVGNSYNMCNRLVRQTTTIANTTDEGYMPTLVSSAQYMYIRIKSERAATIAEFKEWLKTNNIEIIYAIAEPTEEAITLPKLPTVKGTTVYEIDTTIQPSQMDVTYYSNVKGD